MARRGARAAGAGMGRCSEDRKRLRSDIPDAARWARREPSRGGRAFQRPMSTSSRTARGCEKSRLVVSRVGLSTENGLGPARLGCGHARRVRGDDDGGQAGAGTVRTWLSSRNTLGAVPPGPFGSVRLLESSFLVLFSAGLQQGRAGVVAVCVSALRIARPPSHTAILGCTAFVPLPSRRSSCCALGRHYAQIPTGLLRSPASSTRSRRCATMRHAAAGSRSTLGDTYLSVSPSFLSLSLGLFLLAALVSHIPGARSFTYIYSSSLLHRICA